ncbi:hypothetical protein E2C01_002120 [Portunus trituberculatus]|uniref:Uncharacterized protein n=1 Tax=Portunus trituberculatus TaxID=210409 RepID=A0A5B7CMB0_PORTR|nr:hypothetical protein [Portunus trituberculatus]
MCRRELPAWREAENEWCGLGGRGWGTAEESARQKSGWAGCGPGGVMRPRRALRLIALTAAATTLAAFVVLNASVHSGVRRQRKKVSTES